MLFNSVEFLLLYLPIVALIFYCLIFLSFSNRIVISFLVCASLFFYGFWNPVYLLLILSSILLNFTFSNLISKYHLISDKFSLFLLVFGIAVNLIILGYFKYVNFFIETLSILNNNSFEALNVILPLAISFFTFQQIAYLVDIYRREAEVVSILDYSLFVCFFPQLIAGPIVHHRDIIWQFHAVFKKNKMIWQNLSVGIVFITIGLFKKIFLAEKMSFWSDRVFNSLYLGIEPSFIEAWVGTLCFTLQIYFDFSAYSDIAIGLAILFGIKLPLNFYSPYKAISIIDFWKLWHVSLSSFLKNYLYIPLGGNKNGTIRRYLNLLIVMILGGLWHGAGLNFMLWGTLHGFYLMINHFWRTLTLKNLKNSKTSTIKKICYQLLTFLAVSLAWVLFRTVSIEEAFIMYKGLIGLNGIVLPTHYFTLLGDFGGFAQKLGIKSGAVQLYGGGWQIIWIFSLLLFVWIMPNTQQIMYQFKPSINFEKFYKKPPKITSWIVWNPSLLSALSIAGIMMWLIIELLQGASGEFIYFQF